MSLTLEEMILLTLIVNCENCGKEFKCTPSRYENSKHHCCSKEFAQELARKIREENPAYYNCECVICGKKFHLKPYAANRYATHTCSDECHKKFMSLKFTGENNHQFGIRGENNVSWKGGRRISTYGYILIKMSDHPFAFDDGYYPEHRLVAEKYLLNDENSVLIDGKRYLSPEFVVHHKDKNRKNNNVDNLEVMKKGEHVSLHNYEREMLRDNLGRFTA